MAKRTHKILAAFIAVCMIAALFPAAVMAEESAPATGGRAISNAQQLLEFAEEVNAATREAGKTYDGNAYLTNDIDLSGQEMISIAKTNHVGNDNAREETSGYAGTFDGNGHEIKNLNLVRVYNENDPDDKDSIYKCGLFGTINGGTIKNLVVKGTVNEISNRSLVSLFAGSAVNAKFMNCGAEGYTSSYGAAAFIGTTEHGGGNTIFNCWASVDDEASGGFNGFIGNESVGNGTPNTIEHCYNHVKTDNKWHVFTTEGSGAAMAGGLAAVVNDLNNDGKYFEEDPTGTFHTWTVPDRGGQYPIFSGVSYTDGNAPTYAASASSTELGLDVLVNKQTKEENIPNQQQWTGKLTAIGGDVIGVSNVFMGKLALTKSETLEELDLGEYYYNDTEKSVTIKSVTNNIVIEAQLALRPNIYISQDGAGDKDARDAANACAGFDTAMAIANSSTNAVTLTVHVVGDLTVTNPAHVEYADLTIVGEDADGSKAEKKITPARTDLENQNLLTLSDGVDLTLDHIAFDGAGAEASNLALKNVISAGSQSSVALVDSKIQNFSVCENGSALKAGTIVVKGNAIVSGNTDVSSKVANMYLGKGQTIYGIGDLTDSASIGVTCGDAADGRELSQTELENAAGYAQYFSSDDPGYKIAANAAGDNIILTEYVYYIGEDGEDTLQDAIDKASEGQYGNTVKIGDSTRLTGDSDSGTLKDGVNVEDKDGTTFSGSGVTLSVDKSNGDVTVKRTTDGQVTTNVTPGANSDANFKADGKTVDGHEVSVSTNSTIDPVNGTLTPSSNYDNVIIDGIIYSGADKYDLDDPANSADTAIVPSGKEVDIAFEDSSGFKVKNDGEGAGELTVYRDGTDGVLGEVIFGMGEKASVQIGDGSSVTYESASKNDVILDIVEGVEADDYVELKDGGVIVPNGGSVVVNGKGVTGGPVTVNKRSANGPASVIIPENGTCTIDGQDISGYAIYTIDTNGDLAEVEGGPEPLNSGAERDVVVNDGEGTSATITVKNVSDDETIIVAPPVISGDKGSTTVPAGGSVEIKKKNDDTNVKTYHVPADADDDNNVFEFDGNGNVTLVDGEVELGAEDSPIGFGNVVITGSTADVGDGEKKVILKSENDGGTITVPVDGGVTIGDDLYMNAGDTPMILKTDDDGNVTLVEGTVGVVGAGEITINGEKYKTGENGATLEKPETGDIPTLKGGSIVPAGTDGSIKINVLTGTDTNMVEGNYIEVSVDADGKPAVKGVADESNRQQATIDGIRYGPIPTDGNALPINDNGTIDTTGANVSGTFIGNNGENGEYVIVPLGTVGLRPQYVHPDPDAQLTDKENETGLLMPAGTSFDVKKKKAGITDYTNENNLELSIGHYSASASDTKAVVNHETGEVTLNGGSLTILPGIEGDTPGLTVVGQKITTDGATVETESVETGANITLEPGKSFTVKGEPGRTYTAGEDGTVFHMDDQGNVMLISGTDVYPGTREGGSDVTASVSAGTGDSAKTYEVSGSGITLSKETEESETATVTVPKSGSAKVDENTYANAGNTEMIIVLGADGAVLNSGSAKFGNGQTISAKGDTPVSVMNTGSGDIKVSVVAADPEDTQSEEYTTVEIPAGGRANIGGKEISVPGEIPVIVTIGKDGKIEIDPEPGASFKIGDVTYTNEGSSAAITFDENGGVVIPAGAKISETVDIPTTTDLVLKPGEVVKYTTDDGKTITLKGGPESGATVTIDENGNVTSKEGEVLIKLDPAKDGEITKTESDGKAVFVGDVTITVNDGAEKVAEADVTVIADGKEYTGKTDKDGNVTIKDVPYGNDYKVEIKSGDKVSELDVSVSEPEPSASFDLSGGEVTPDPTPSAEPSAEPSSEPSAVPTEEPTAAPTDEPSAAPTDEPTTAPTDEPTTAPTDEPTTAPTEQPTTVPTDEPTTAPSNEPTATAQPLDDQKYDEAAPTDVVITLPDAAAEVTKITINGAPVPKDSYTVKDGVITFTPEFLNTLPEGANKVEIEVLDGGKYEMNINVVNKPEETSAPMPTRRPSSGGGFGGGTFSTGGSTPGTAAGPEVTAAPEATDGPNVTAGPDATAAPSLDENTCPRDNTCPISKFGDASPNDWYHDGVHYCLERSIMNGYDDSQFGPNDGLTRGMVAQMLYNLNGKPVAAASGFADVPADSWYASAIAWAPQIGIVEGYDETSFGPEDFITREQMAAIIYRYEIVAGGNAPQIPAEFAFPDDNLVSDWAYSAVVWNAAQGIIKGDENGMFRSADSITRAEAATMLQRWLEPHVKDASGLKF